MNKNMIIGIIGGMGSFATVDFFRRVVEAFPAEKEWERPRILIDNYCTMPSRVRAILYNEKRDELVSELSEATKNMLRSGATHIILACNTSHVFLPDIIKKVPEASDKFINIIEELAKDLKSKAIKDSFLLATEGTIQTGIYEKFFSKYDINIHSPVENEYSLLRDWIEAVKQNKFNKSIYDSFEKFCDNCNQNSIILGCTELPILYEKAKQNGWINKLEIFDPLQNVIEILKREFYN